MGSGPFAGSLVPSLGDILSIIHVGRNVKRFLYQFSPISKIRENSLEEGGSAILRWFCKWWELAPAAKAAGTEASRNERKGSHSSLLERRTGWEILTLREDWQVFPPLNTRLWHRGVSPVSYAFLIRNSRNKISDVVNFISPLVCMHPIGIHPFNRYLFFL